ncbi:MAG TPA: aminoglycoside phosphotransferase family protein [Pirellulales bacterium]|nr:aminoglycoside phosphotransferase family protein [Pirellulales bacterium]
MANFHLLNAANAETYLRGAGWIDPVERVSIRELSGGVSNEVLYVARPDRPGEDFVLKQARAQLRTPDPWFCDVERIWREVDVLRICERLLAARPSDAHALVAHTPRILREDRDNYAFTMTAAPAEHRVWKAELLEGQARPEIAAACGRLLARLHGASWLNAAVAQRLDDRRVFDDLRLDPYYRSVARAYPDDAPAFERLIDSVWQHRRCLVHADFSPKNLLVFQHGLLMVDFETGHFGDPAFDLGFFLSHLLLKAACFAPRHEAYLRLTDVFRREYRAELSGRIGDDEWRDLERRAVQNFAGCAWARLDGISRIDYLADPARRGVVRSLCRDLLRDTNARWQTALELFNARLGSNDASGQVG